MDEGGGYDSHDAEADRVKGIVSGEKNKPTIRVLSLGEPVPVGPERFVLCISVTMPNEQMGRELATLVARMLQVYQLEATVALIGAQSMVEPSA